MPDVPAEEPQSELESPHAIIEETGSPEFDAFAEYMRGNGTEPDSPRAKSDETNVHELGPFGLGQYMRGAQSGFQVDLGTSRVYMRTERYKSDVSFTSSAVRSHAWSVFTGLSLSEVSVISAIALPLYLDEIYNNAWYSRTAAHASTEKTRPPIPLSTLTEPIAEASINTVADVLISHAHSGSSSKHLNATQKSVTSSPFSNALELPPERMTSQGSRQMVLYQLTILGDTGVGKTQLVNEVNFST